MQGTLSTYLKALGLSLLFVSSPLYAFFSVPYGWYFEGNAGVTKIHDQSFNGGSTTTSGSSVGGSLILGYKFMPYFGGEIGYTAYANQKNRRSIW